VLHLDPVALASGVGAWFSGRDRDGPEPPVGRAGNLAHRRPHRPSDLAAARAELATRTGTRPSSWHLLRQVHGAAVAVVDATTPPGAELPDVDAAVTAELERPLLVQVADCVPVVLAGPRGIGVAHAGRRGVETDVIGATLTALEGLGDPPDAVHAAIGPAIGGCCYEVPAAMQAEVVARAPAALATTTWGTPALDLPAAVEVQLAARGVPTVERVGGCTRCDPDQRWFSHRADATTGRQVGIIVRFGAADDETGA
jgi:polyphenol oxidase